MMISIDYEEFKPETYKGVYVFGAKPEIKSYTGNPVKDMDNVIKILNEKLSGQSISVSSSVDHFLMDDKSQKYTNKYNKNGDWLGLKLNKKKKLKSCCKNEKRSMVGGCVNCGDPSY